MKNKQLFKLTTAFIVSIISFFSVCLLFPVIPSYADGITENGKYKISFDTSITNAMGMGAFENKAKKAVVEKIDDFYYLTMSFDSDSVINVKMVNDKNVGFTSVIDGNIIRITYTMSYDTLIKTHSFSAYIPAMNMGKEFTITPDLEGAERIGDADLSFERPPEFIPVILTSAGDTEMEKGSTYLVPSATATLNGEALPVTVSAYSLIGETKSDVEIVDNKIQLAEAGEYHVVYKSESDKYKTNKGNNTVKIQDVKIISKLGATSLAKVENIEGKNVLLDNVSVQAGRIAEESEIALLAKEKLKKITEQYELINVNIYNEDGSVPELTDNVAMYIAVNNMYDRRKIEVYHLADDGSLTEIECQPYGRYVRLETDKTGNFVVCIPGISIKIDSMGIMFISISVGMLVVGAFIVPLIIIIIKRRNAKLALQSAEETSDNVNDNENNIPDNVNDIKGNENQLK